MQYKIKTYSDQDILRACRLRGLKEPLDLWRDICCRVIPEMTNGGRLWRMQRYISPVTGEFYYKWWIRVPVTDAPCTFIEKGR